MLSVKRRRQVLQLCLDTAVVVVIKIYQEFLHEVFHRIELMEIKQFTFEQPKEIFDHSIVQTVSLFSWYIAVISAFSGSHLSGLLICFRW